MTVYDSRERGQRSPFFFRYSQQVPVRGMRNRRDPGAVSLPWWWLARNVRWNDEAGSRAGSVTFLDGLGAGAANTAVTSIFDFQNHQSYGLNRLYLVIDGCPGISAGVGASLNFFSRDSLDQFTRGPYYSGTASDPTLAFFDQQLWIGMGDTLSRFQTLEPDWEEELLDVAGIGQEEPIKTFTGFTITAMWAAFGELFIGLDAGAGASKIMRYDGTTFRTDDTAIDPPRVMRTFRNDFLVVGFSTTGLRVRTSAGVWSAVAGATPSADMVEYRDNLYVASGATTLWKYDGAAFAVDRTVAGATIRSVATFDGYLFYGYSTGAAAAMLGRLDSAGTYVDAHKNFTTQLAGAVLPKQLAFYRGVLIAGVNTAANGSRLFLSPGTNTAGTWQIITPNAAANGDLVAFAVF